MSDLLKTLFLEEEVVATSDLTENVFSEPITIVAQTQTKFKKKLVARVRKHPQLYDRNHEEFSNEEIKYIIWNKIAEKLNVDVDTCIHAWTDLRYEYQRYVRRMRQFLRYGNHCRKRRPAFALESEMLFMWRFIANISSAPLPFTKVEKNSPISMQEDDDDIVIVDDDPVVIILDDEDKPSTEDEERKFRVTQEMRKLIELVKGYPELYDSDHQYFADYRRKSIIWNGIANESHDKATRLMKLWIQLQTRYEWELWHNKTPLPEDDTNDLRKVLEFMKEAILKNPKTVYKQSLFLKLAWYEPIDHFKNIFNLIASLKKNLDVINETEKKLSPHKDSNYVSAWTKLANARPHSQQAGQMEATWLILRFFYWELMSMRKTSYQLQDKWYFESIITDIYAQAKLVAEHQKVRTPTPTPTPPAPSPATTTATISLAQPTAPTMTQPTLAAVNKIVPPKPHLQPPPLAPVTSTPARVAPLAMAPQIFNTPPNQQPQIVMPKIVSAKSLAAPQVNPAQLLNTPKGLQIYQVMPQNAMTVIPLQQQRPPINAYATATATATIQNQQLPNLTSQLNLPVLHNMMTIPKIASVHTMSSVASATRPTNTAPRASLVPTKLTPQLPTSTTTATSASPSPINMMHIPAKIVPIRARAPKQATQPIPVKLVAAPNAAVPMAPIPKPTPTTTTTSTLSPIQPAIRQPVKQLPMPALTVFRSPQSNNNNVTSNIQINAINKENTAANGISDLNCNEIMIELISTPDGNRLVVHGPPLAVDYSLNMTEVTAFIREVMAFPLLHNKNQSQASRVQAFWVFMASKFNMPAHVCKACWNFLSENFNHFPKIAPIEVLMAPPFTSDAYAWQENTELFKRLYETYVQKGWFVHERKLPGVMYRIGEEPCLYQDLCRSKDASIAPVNSLQVQTAWSSLRAIFGIQDVDCIWTAFKSAFWHFMLEVECGYENHWPQPLWRTLSEMGFLISQRYSKNEPFFYIVRNKFTEEVARCKMLENKQRAAGPGVTVEKKATPYEIDAYNLLAAIRQHSHIYLSDDAALKEEAWRKVANELNTSVVACRLTFQRALKNYRACMARDPPKRCRLNQRYYKHMHAIYRTVTTSQKINIRTPSELNQGVADAAEANDIVFPDRMIMDINVDNSEPALVMKNWMYGVGNCKLSVQHNLSEKLQDLFNSYEKFATDKP